MKSHPNKKKVRAKSWSKVLLLTTERLTKIKTRMTLFSKTRISTRKVSNRIKMGRVKCKTEALKSQMNS
jgi:hypothetical protein